MSPTLKMKQLKDKKTVQKLLKAAISHLCRVSVGLEGNFIIDGIICIAQGESDEHEVVVKIHEKIDDKELHVPTPGIQVNSSSKQSENISVQGDETATQNIPYVDNVVSTKNMNNFCKIMRDHGNDQTNVARGKQLLEIEDDDVEYLGISEAKQLFGDLDNFSDIECTGYDLDDVSFSDVVIKPDPGNIGKSVRSYGTSNIDEESSDEELKIEQLKAGRVRKPHKGAYRDVHGAPVQLLSTEEFKRILKSEKLKRSRDKSPDFVSAPKMLKTGQESFSGVQIRQQFPQSHSVSVQSQVQIPKTVIGSLSYLTNAVKTSLSHPISNKTSIVKHTSSSQENVKNKEPTFIQRSPSSVSHIQNPDYTRPKMVKSFIQQTSAKTQLISSANVCINTGRIIDSASANSNLNQSVLNVVSDANTYTEVPTNGCYDLIPQTVLRQTESPLSINNQEKINIVQQNVTKSELSSSSSGGVICLDTCNEATKSDVHKCPVCCEVFESFRFLDLHMYRQHPGMFLCPLCGKSFKQRSTRNRHIVALHSSEKNFICSMCNVAFTRADTLKKHISVSHPGVDIPKTTFSYTKGVELPTAVQAVQQQHLQDYTSDMALSDTVYGEGVITPIQVTAASLENAASPFTSSDPSSFVAVQPGNITNITPIHPNMCADNLILAHNITPNLAPEISKDSFVVAEHIIGQQQQNESVAKNFSNIETVCTVSTTVPIPKAPETVLTTTEMNVSSVNNLSCIVNPSLVTASTSEIIDNGNKEEIINDNFIDTVQPLNMSHKQANFNNGASAVFSDSVKYSTSNTQNVALNIHTGVSTVINSQDLSSVSIESIKPITNIEKLNSHKNHTERQELQVDDKSNNSDHVLHNANTVEESANLEINREVLIDRTGSVNANNTDQSGANMYESIVTERTVTDICNTIEISDEDTNDQSQQNNVQH